MSNLLNQVMVTIVAPLAPDALARAQAAIDMLGNPASDAIRAKLDTRTSDAGVHFMSLHALPSGTPNRAHLIFEFSADGDQARAIAQIAHAIAPELTSVFALASDWRDGDIGQYLTAHKIKIGVGLGANPGLAFAGTPGLSVGQILSDATLADDITAKLAGQERGMSALHRLAAVRASFPADSDCLKPTDAVPPFQAASVPAVIVAAIGSFLKTYLWPVVALIIGLALLRATYVTFCPAWHPHLIEHHWPLVDMLHQSWWGRALLGIGLFLKVLVMALVCGAVLLLMGLIVIGAAMYFKLRTLEATDWISTRAPDRDTLHDITARENIYAHNHMMSLTQLKGGRLRNFLVRLVFWGIGTLAGMLYKPGFLGSIGTIHFARWITVPGTRDFVFFSNFGGSWESYLEDFITLAHDGLTGVWSNAEGFPRTNNLIQDGATDGERFKRYARQSMLPTRFWYSAYPTLTTDNIRRNAMIRRGLSGAMTEDDAAAWLGLFGSAGRPVEKLVGSEIQSLLFGGMGFLPHGTCTFWTLPHDTKAARAWLRDVTPYIAFNDGRRVRDDPRIEAAVQFALSSVGLARLGLPKDGLATFPAAFLDDMTAPGRARIIGDTGENGADNWWWGRTAFDTALLVYGETPEAVAALENRLADLAQLHGASCPHRIPLQPVEQIHKKPVGTVHDATEVKRYFGTEPFGFADGVSQPVMSGTYKGLKDADPMHLVEPGEFILGYPDNRGNLPPGPHLDALHDPANILPIIGADRDFATNSVNLPRDLGHNGSYLVIRQLEQDVAGFGKYCEDEAERLKARFAPPYVVTPEFIGAKLVGRWKNGSPLVRAPYTPSKAGEIITENRFQLGSEDPEGLRCPFGSHIRRTNPRDSLMPGSDEQISITNRHRIMRVGRQYAPLDVHGQKPGLLFMCLNGDLERQFEFIQQTWANSCSFMALSGEQDPILGGGTTGHNGYTIPTRDGPVKLSPMSRFVTMRGGGYFFLPGKRLIHYLSL